MKQNISKAVIKRLPRYYRYLGELLDAGITRISSEELSKIMKVTASQIRQDLNNFGGFGHQGYGYNVETLKDEIAVILGLKSPHNLIIVGGGNLGRAIAGYPKFGNRGFIVKAIFDNDKSVIGSRVGDIETYSVDSLESIVPTLDIDIAVLTMPKEHAAEIAERLYKLGIKAFWNFAHTDLQLPGDAFCENVHLSDSLMQLSYRLKNSL